MHHASVLTIAVPIYNMEQWLDKNLKTYCHEKLRSRLEVICVNNASTDRSKEIAEKYCENFPDIFRFIDRSVDDYGAAVNDVLSAATGAYFRIVDADDWVDTEELLKLVEELERCKADVVLTDFKLVDMQTGKMSAVRAGKYDIEYGRIYTNLDGPSMTLPSIHATTYRTDLLKENRFSMQTGIFFVDEEYVILPYLYVKTVVYYPFDVYRYQVANPNQSMSPTNRAKYYFHREKVLRRLIHEYHSAVSCEANEQALRYCRERIGKGVGDHFTTLYMYIPDRNKGRTLARRWKQYLLDEAPEFWQVAKRKALALYILNSLHISLPRYEWLKKRKKIDGRQVANDNYEA